jgi:hypothetical protein
MSPTMSTAAQTLVEEFKSLPATEQIEVSAQIQRWLGQSATTPPAAGADPIRSARGMLAGSRVTEALLANRAEERRHG